MSKKFLRKDEFRFYKNKKFLSKSGEPHPAYIFARYGRKYKFNVITHSRSFFGESNMDLQKNPYRLSTDRRTSRISVPRWDYDSNFSEERLHKKDWKFSRNDKIAIIKWNKKYK